MFAARYPDVPVAVENAGIPGERANAGGSFAAGLLSPTQPATRCVTFSKAPTTSSRGVNREHRGRLRADGPDGQGRWQSRLLCTNPPALARQTDPAAIHH